MYLYELTYLISSKLSQEEIKSLEEIIKSFIQEKEGSVGQVNFPIKKRLAYPIKKNQDAFLANLSFSLKPEGLKNLEKKIRSEKQILRYLILKKKLPRKKLVRKRKLKVLLKPEVKPKRKVELKEIEKKLEEILGE